ncbi:hypothetical protein D3C83_23550 [compost metagenome]
MIHVRVEFGRGLELREVFEFLVGVAMARHGCRSARHRDHGRAGEIRVLQPRREIRCAHVLSHAHAGFPARPRVAVRHVRGGLLAVRHDAPDAHALHRGKRLKQHLRHEEDVRHAVSAQRIGDKARAGGFRH